VNHAIREAALSDLNALLALETACFEGDRLSRRSLRAFIHDGAHHLLVWEEDAVLRGYALLLFRRGTLLARLYSLAVHPDCRGRGIAGQLLDAAEDHARQRNCMFLRLEVREDNRAAIALYEQRGYRRFDRVTDYYEDAAAALRMEKRLRGHAKEGMQQAPAYYRQTTEFTCGPASLMMAMHQLDPTQALNQRQELQLWREATTIYMTAGHGGCHPMGLAIAAHKRGLNASVWCNQQGPLFVDSVRDTDKKQVITTLHEHFARSCKAQQIPVHYQDFTAHDLDSAIAQGKVVLVLISTWRLDGRKAPHWVAISGSDEECFYIHDPDPGEDQVPLDCQHVPIAREKFEQMRKYGQAKLRTAVVLGG